MGKRVCQLRKQSRYDEPHSWHRHISMKDAEDRIRGKIARWCGKNRIRLLYEQARLASSLSAHPSPRLGEGNSTASDPRRGVYHAALDALVRGEEWACQMFESFRTGEK